MYHQKKRYIQWKYQGKSPLETLIDHFPEKAMWNEYSLSQNPNITWEFVQAHPDKPWYWPWLSRNPNITWDIVQAHLEMPWDWNGLSCNPNITWDIVQAHPKIEWDWYLLSQNLNITCEIVQDHPEMPWHWEGISRNSYLYDDIVYRRSLQKDVQAQQEKVTSFLLTLSGLYQDVIRSIVQYVNYD